MRLIDELECDDMMTCVCWFAYAAQSVGWVGAPWAMTCARYVGFC